MNFRDYLSRCQGEVEFCLDRLVRTGERGLVGLYDSMRYSLLYGGKRLRASLVMAVADAITGTHSHVLNAACALEMIHSYSLIHDDLPCMDDDQFRRGKPTNHLVYGEAMAVLAGDGLLTEAFSVMVATPVTSPVTKVALCQAVMEMAEAAGPSGMVGGQAMDIEAEGKSIGLSDLQAIHRLKTGRLFRAAVRISAILSAASCSSLSVLTDFAEDLGLAFQIRDDILDVTSNREKLGKEPGRDEALEKATYPRLLGVEESERLMEETARRGMALLESIDLESTVLASALAFAATRDS